MNWFDIVLILILAVSVITSFRKGLSREIIGLVSAFLGLVLGIWFYGTAAAWVQPYFDSATAAKFAGFFLIFFGVVLLGSLIRFVVGKFLRVTGLSFFDHALGAAFGAMRGGLIAVALVTGVMAFAKNDRPPDAVLHSRLAPYVVNGARVVTAVAPHELKEGFRKSYAEARVAWKSALDKSVAEQAHSEKGTR